MWIGSPLRGAFRLTSYVTLTLVLLPLYLLALWLNIRPVIRWMPVAYHRVVCFVLGIKVRVFGQLSGVTPTLFVCNHVDRKSTRLNSSHVSESRMPSSA